MIRTRLWRVPENPKRVGRLDPESRRSFETQLREMILALRAFPSIAAWVPFNEGWGQFDTARIAAWVFAIWVIGSAGPGVVRGEDRLKDFVTADEDAGTRRPARPRS